MKFLESKIFLLEFLFCSVLATRGEYNIAEFEYEMIHPRKSTSFLSNIAHELIQRSTSSSQVIVYGAGYFGNHTFKGRETKAEDHIFSEGEAALTMGYIIGENCLYRAACEVPHTAKEYLGAAKIVFATLKLVPQFVKKYDEPYKSVMLELEKAIDLGLKGNCPSNYNCKEENFHRF